MTRTSVLVDGRSLGGDGRYRGFGRYLAALLKELAGEGDLDLRVLLTEPAELPSEVRPIQVRRWAPPRFAAREHELRLPRDIARNPSDVFHCPGHEPPRRIERPWVQTLHDVIPAVYDDPAYENDRRWWQSRAERFRRADAVVADSTHSANEGVRVLGLDPARLHVVHLSADPQFKPAIERMTSTPPHVLVVAEYGPNKGYREAFAAIAGLAAAGWPHRLKVAGRLAPWVRPTVDGILAASPRPDLVDLLGYVSDEDLVRLYQTADLVLITSRAEGFCLPAVEAMATGTPVVAFANTAITEVVRGGGELVDDGDVEALVATASALLADRSRWENVSARCLERAATFSWPQAAAAYAEIYRAVASA